METVFLSYTYDPHPAHENDLEQLRRSLIEAIEAMGLRIIDGVNVGGRPLDDGLRQRIEEADCLIALVTPQADGAGKAILPAFVLSEFQYAEGLRKPTLRVLHHELPQPVGLGAGNEYTPYTPGKEIKVLLKVLNTIAQWRLKYGQRARVRIEPADLTKLYDEGDGYRCEYKVISNGVFGDFQKALLTKEPGAAYALLPMLRQSDRILLQFRKGDKTWRAPDVIDPFVGGVTLEEKR
jgi:hypothetical protein